MTDSPDAAARPRLVARTLRSVLLCGGLACIAGGWLSATLTKDRDTLSRLSGNVGRNAPDPLTTGSVGRSAEATRLDPCAIRRP